MAGTTISVFISYSHQEANLAKHIVTRLKEREERESRLLRPSYNVKVWTDAEIHAGVDWVNAVDTAIARSDMFVVTVPGPEHRSAEVRRECQLALAQRKRILPICISSVDTANLDYYGLRRVHALTFDPLRQVGAMTSIDNEITQMCRAIESERHRKNPLNWILDRL